MWQELTLLFTEMGASAAICLLLGLVFIIIEIFNPGFGFFGITGGLLVLAGMVLRVTDKGNGNPIAQFFLLFLIMLIIIGAAFALMVWSAKRGWLSRTAFIEKRSAVPEGLTEGTVDYSGLLQKRGVALSMLRPSGIIEIDGKRYDVVTSGEYIAKDSVVEVLAIEGVKIVVKEVK